MSIYTLLVNAVYSEQEYDILRDNITSEILNEFRLLSSISIDRLVDGDLDRFAEIVDEMGCILELEPSFPGIRDYLTHHILEGVSEWDDHTYCRCVAVGLLSFVGINQDAMG